METAYLAAAILAPEDAVVPRLMVAEEHHDIDIGDVKEPFYLSSEMAAWRTANLLTHHFGIRCHLIVSDEVGSIVKGYSKDGVPTRRDEYGGMETQRLYQKCGSRVTFRSEDHFSKHHQYTDTGDGTFFCTTHIEAGREPAHTITIGALFDDAKWFRGRESENREVSTCPDDICCRIPSETLSSNWGGKVIVSARSQARILGLLAPNPNPNPNPNP